MYVFNAIEQDSIGLFKEYMRDWPQTIKCNVLFENYEELKEIEQRTLLHFAIDCNVYFHIKEYFKQQKIFCLG